MISGFHINKAIRSQPSIQLGFHVNNITLSSEKQNLTVFTQIAQYGPQGSATLISTKVSVSKVAIFWPELATATLVRRGRFHNYVFRILTHWTIKLVTHKKNVERVVTLRDTKFTLYIFRKRRDIYIYIYTHTYSDTSANEDNSFWNYIR
jgi:hypothetical protein